MRVVRVREVRGSLLALVQHDVVALVDAGAVHAVAAQGSHDHFGVFVAREDGGGADDGPVDVSLVVEDGAAAAAAADEVHGSIEAGSGERVTVGFAILVAGGGVEEGEVYF